MFRLYHASLNYLRFFGLFTPYIQKELFMLLIFSSFATTISLFLHTLRFKRYLAAPVSFGIYVASYMGTFISYWNIAYVFVAYPGLTAVALGGLILNLVSINYIKSNILFDIYQVAVMVAAYTGHLPV